MNVKLDSLPAPALVVEDDVVLDANERATDVLGSAGEVLRGRRIVDLIPAWPDAIGGRRSISVGERRFLVLDGGSGADTGSGRVVLLVDVTMEYLRDAEQADRDRASFLAKLSHEIRSAVASMVGFAEMLGDRVDDEDLEMTKIITASGRHLIDTLNGVIDLARIEFGEKEIELVEVDIVRHVRDRVEILRRDAERKDIELVFAPDVDEMTAQLHPLFLDRILHNLIDNAIKYTDEGRVEMDVERRDGRIWLYVADTGRGMDTAFIPRLFAPFERERRGARGERGTGLGLAMTRSLVELMDGRIHACSTLGEGSTFTVSFPDPAG
ncbi:MAG: HAMP domain-containing sensor histidine kinase [Rhodothermales bacterium]